MWKIITLAGVLIVAGVLIAAAMQPDDFAIERQALVKAPPEKVYALLEDFGRAQEWSPYEKKDPAMKRALSGAPRGKGSVYAFDGNGEVGAGRLEIIDATPPSKVVVRLDMEKPFKASNIIEYSMAPAGDSTRVTWAMRGKANYLSKVMCLFMDMDKMVGKDFEAGLAALKSVVEK
jgi:uncharacterized protein YndB with AHSA1/START domain